MCRALLEAEVETNLINRLKEMGYEYVFINSYDGVIQNFRTQIEKVNAEKLIEGKGVTNLSDTEFDRIMTRFTGDTIYGFAKKLREKYPLRLDNGKTVYMEFLTSDSSRNTYQIAHQITMDPEDHQDVRQRNRYDVTVLINGLPLVQIELKHPGIELNEAINQINRYRQKSFAGLFKLIQVFVVSNSAQTKYFANINENNPRGEKQNILKSLVFYWTDENNNRINRLIDFANDFFNKDNLTDLLTKYFVIKETEPILMVMRPYQIYAVKRAVDRVLGSNMNGYVFHTTGSGKTLTSYKLASILRDNNSIEKVIFLIDRKDLDEQTVEEYNSFERGCVDTTENTGVLVDALGPDNTTKKLIITTIQKMAVALRTERYAPTMDYYRNKRCVFIIDECHRSQVGTMHQAIENHFKNANFIGFTGTPIFDENRGNSIHTTAEVFAPIRDEQNNTAGIKSCIHKYMIKEAIADGNVLPFSVEYMNFIRNIRIGNKSIDVNRIDDPAYCRANYINVADIYHNPERIQMVANDIMEQLGKHTRLGQDDYTAIFAVDKIKYLMEYYHCLKKHPRAYNKETNPNGYKIAAIFTLSANNEDFEDDANETSDTWLQECMEDYGKMFDASFDTTKFDAYRKDISKRMKQKDLPQVDLLLVVNMFLTGFDSKVTNTLILDKDLVWHSLLQAYSRTNRVDKKTKQFGNVISYRNIRQAQDDALRLFSGGGNPNDFLIPVYEVWVSKYREATEKVYAIAEDVRVLENLQSEDDQAKFVRAFKEIARTLATLKTFSKFDWNDLNNYMDEATFADYKSWYFTYYDKQKRADPTTPTLLNIDFEIELVKTDRINVVYILNLLKEINREDMIETDQAIDLIMREIERSDNEKLRYKKDLLKEFIKKRFLYLKPDEDIKEAYHEFETNSMKKQIQEFANENNLDPNLISNIVSEYFGDSRMLTEDNLWEKLRPMKLGILQVTEIISKITNFVKEIENKYTAEGI